MEALGRVLEHDLGVRGRRQLLAEPCTPDGELCDAGAVETEDDAPLGDRRRVVEMHDRALRAGDGLERARDELGPRLRQHGDRRPARNEILLDQEPHEVEVRPGGGRESDLDLGDSECEQQREEPLLARAVHRIDERLVAVPEVGRAPDRGRVDDTVGPGSIGKIDSCVRTVLPVRHGHRAALLGFDAIARLWTHQGCERNGYVDASLPLPGKEEREAGQQATAWKELRGPGWSRGHDSRSVAESPEPPAFPPRGGRVVHAERTVYRSALMSGAVPAGTALAAAIRTIAIFGFGPIS